MSNEETIETLEIANLEYEVGGMSALEPAESRVSHADSIVVVITQ